MSQAGIINVSSQSGVVDSVTGANGVTASPTTGNVVVSGINATTSSVGVASFNPANFTVDAGGQVSAIAGGSSIAIIQGDSGTISGGIVRIWANNAANLAGASVKFINSATISILQLTDGNSNTFIGTKSGNLTQTSSNNTGIGYGSLGSLTTDSGSNVAIGLNALGSLTSSSGQNFACGTGAGANLLTGNSNTLIGSGSGSGYTSSESSNVILGTSIGSVLENNVLRLGNQGSGAGLQNKCFIAGIISNTVSNAQMVTINSSTTQLGSQAIPSGGLAPQFNTGAVVASNQTAVTVPFIASNPSSSMASTVNIQNSSMYLVPIYLDENKTYVALGCLVTNAPGIGSTVDFVLYDNTAAGGLPGNLVASAVNVDSSISSIIEGTISYSANIGWYWIGIQRNVVATVTVRGYSNGDDFSSLTNKVFYNPANPTSTNFQSIAYFGATNTYGTYPNSPTLTQNQPTNVVPLIYIR